MWNGGTWSSWQADGLRGPGGHVDAARVGRF